MASESGESNGDQDSPRLWSANWTVVDPGKTPVPTSDDYTAWSVNQLRKECTSRKLRLSRNTPAADRIRHLQEYDAYHRSLVQSTIESGETQEALPSAKYCCFRLTILFSDAFAVRFADIGDQPSRQQLDASDVHGNASFWRDVAAELNTNRTGFNKLLCSNARFDGIDPAVFAIHDAAKLYDSWKGLNKRYLKAVARFTKSGENEDDFFDYCAGDLDMFYLRTCLEQKHDLTNFVEGGLLDDDEYDSLKRDSSSQQVLSPPRKRPSAVDRLMSMHKLIEFVERQIGDLQTKGRSYESLQKSLDIYNSKLSEMESALVSEK